VFRLVLTAIGILAVIVTSAGAQSVSPNGVKTLSPAGAIKPTGTWDLATRAGDFIYIAGMRGIDPKTDTLVQGDVYGYTGAQTLVQALKQCGDDLSRANVMKQAANLKDVELPMLLPGVKINTSPSDYFPIEQMQMERFNGNAWELFGPVISVEGEN
jgi:hypothetical protein